MRVSSIKLANFKRFTDLRIVNIPAEAKLVVVVGSNGCGKSSLFDAMLQWYRRETGFGVGGDNKYFRKDEAIDFAWDRTVLVDLHEGTVQKGCFYLRSAYRNDPDFTISSFQKQQSPIDETKLQRSIDPDKTVGENYQRLVYQTVHELYEEANDSKSVKTLREELIGEVRASMRRVFGDLILRNLSDPLNNGTFHFEKGTTKEYHYKNLSGGEKAAFDLLLDLHVKKTYFPDAIYCVDEIETHLHTRLQGAILREMLAVLPARSQLWVTTHSLGVMREALNLEAASPGQVCVIDFDGVNPDSPTEIEPSSLGRITWEKLLSIAVDDLSLHVAPEYVVICEGSSVGRRRKDFDAEIYNRIFSTSHKRVVFISGGNSDQVQTQSASVSAFLQALLPSTRVHALKDRDDLSDTEVQNLRTSGTLVLDLRHLESYLFSDDVIKALVLDAGKPELLEQVLAMKDEFIAASMERGNPSDDLKSVAGQIYVELKRMLSLRHAGNNVDAFMRDTLAPLIRPGMPTYDALRACIADRLLVNN